MRSSTATGWWWWGWRTRTRRLWARRMLCRRVARQVLAGKARRALTAAARLERAQERMPALELLRLRPAAGLIVREAMPLRRRSVRRAAAATTAADRCCRWASRWTSWCAARTVARWRPRRRASASARASGECAPATRWQSCVAAPGENLTFSRWLRARCWKLTSGCCGATSARVVCTCARRARSCCAARRSGEASSALSWSTRRALAGWSWVATAAAQAPS
mmetsp:Transcript_17665/g.54861  ORF Transcript_17665/g.54861 Transcript_17665/m.54861 type:complete len:222 (+) Transcript_17665:187-852(+)